MLRITWNLNVYFNMSVILETLFNYMFVKVIRLGNKILSDENVFLLCLVLMPSTLWFAEILCLVLISGKLLSTDSRVL